MIHGNCLCTNPANTSDNKLLLKQDTSHTSDCTWKFGLKSLIQVLGIDFKSCFITTQLFCATQVCPFTIKSISTIHGQSRCTTRNVAQHDWSCMSPYAFQTSASCGDDWERAGSSGGLGRPNSWSVWWCHYASSLWLGTKTAWKCELFIIWKLRCNSLLNVHPVLHHMSVEMWNRIQKPQGEILQAWIG
jgi:hypothetical protein